MKLFKFFSVLILCLLIGISSLWFARGWFVTTLAQFYLKKYDIALQMKVVTLSTERLLIHDIILNHKTLVPIFEIEYSLFEKKVSTVKLKISQLDLNSFKDILQKLQTDDQSQASPPPSFSEGLEVCQKILEPRLEISVDKIVFDQKTIAPNLSLEKKSQGLHLQWSDPQFKGDVNLHCGENLISLEMPTLSFRMNEFRWDQLSIDHLEFEASRSFLKWSQKEGLQLALPGRLSLSAKLATDRLKIETPFVLLSGQSATSDLNHVVVQGLLKNGSLEMAQNLSFDVIDMVHHFNLQNPKPTSKGTFQFRNLSLKTKKKLVQGLNVISKYDWDGDKYSLNVDLRDRTKELQISNLKITGSPTLDEHKIQLDPKRSLIQLNSQIADWLPPLKDAVKAIQGDLQFQGQALIRQKKLSGTLKVVGQKISAKTEFGNFENLSFSHEINSFETFASPRDQHLEVDRILIGPGVTNLKMNYHVENLKVIKVDELSLLFEEAQITARNFSLNGLDKRVENFSAVILNLSLEKTLALALKDTVTAQGRLQGHLDIDYRGNRPIIKGLLAAPTEGWIRYRTGKPQGQLSISDGPMDILNSYLYNFHYNNLSLKISSDPDYNMHMLLGTLGHNPDYLDGKPLKLNIDLQQNLLAALQSMMLTYDLPSRIKDRLEKVDP